MNLILFSAEEIAQALPSSDPRARHLLEVLKVQLGQDFDAGLIDGPRGKGRIRAIDPTGLQLNFSWGETPPPLPPLHLLIGLPRPQTARKILQEATALGVARIDFFTTERGEPSYAQSTLWTTEEWRRHLRAGAEQAFCTRLPRVTWGKSLREVLSTLPVAGTRLALDNYEATMDLAAWSRAEATGREAPLHLALGAERGWAAEERSTLRQEGFELAHLGPRVLRLETAVVAAVSLARARWEAARRVCENTRPG